MTLQNGFNAIARKHFGRELGPSCAFEISEEELALLPKDLTPPSQTALPILRCFIFNVILTQAATLAIMTYQGLRDNEEFSIITPDDELFHHVVSWRHDAECRNLLSYCIEMVVLNTIEKLGGLGVDLALSVDTANTPGYNVLFFTPAFNKLDLTTRERFLEQHQGTIDDLLGHVDEILRELDQLENDDPRYVHATWQDHAHFIVAQDVLGFALS